MSKKSTSLYPPSKMNEIGEDDDEDEDDVVISPRLSKNFDKSRKINKPEVSTQKQNLNDSTMNSKSLKNSHERDSFLNAFLDRDANQRHEPLALKSHHESRQPQQHPKESAPPKPKPRPSPRNEVIEQKNGREKSPARPPATTPRKDHTKNYEEGDNKKDPRQKSPFDLKQSGNRSTDFGGKTDFHQPFDKQEKELSQLRDNDLRNKTPEESATRNNNYDTKPSKYENNQLPVKSPRADIASKLRAGKENKMEQLKRESPSVDIKTSKNIHQDEPVRTKKPPVKSPRPTAQPSSKDMTSKLLDGKNNTENNVERCSNNKPVKKERPTKSPRSASGEIQQQPKDDQLRKKSLGNENDEAYTKNLSQFNDLSTGKRITKDVRNEKLSHREDRNVVDKKEREIDSLFDIGGRRATVKKNTNGDTDETGRRRKSIDDKDQRRVLDSERASEKGRIDNIDKRGRNVNEKQQKQQLENEISLKRDNSNERSPRPISSRDQQKQQQQQQQQHERHQGDVKDRGDSKRTPVKIQPSQRSFEGAPEKQQQFEQEHSDPRRRKSMERNKDDDYRDGKSTTSSPSRKVVNKNNTTTPTPTPTKDPSSKRHPQPVPRNRQDEEKMKLGDSTSSFKRHNPDTDQGRDGSSRDGLPKNRHNDGDIPRERSSRSRTSTTEDQQLDSFFDAGSKRSGSAKKEKVKSDKLNESLRQARHQSPSTRDEDEDVKGGNQPTPTRTKGDQSRGNSAHKKKPVPMKANLSMSEMTKSPVLKKEATTPKKNRPLSSTHRAKSSSLTNISNLMAPRSNSPITYDDVSNMDGKTLRDQIYTDWLQRKRSFTKEESKVRKEKLAREEEEKQRRERERKMDAQKSFQAWGGKKEEVLKGKRKDTKKKDQSLKEQEDEKLQKTKDAKKFFESWKQQKDEEIKKTASKGKKEEREKKSREVNEKMEKTEDAKKVFENWKAKRDEEIKEQQKEKAKAKRKEEEEAKLDEVEKKQAAQRSYEAWKERKVKDTKRPVSAATSLQQRPWCPSSRKNKNAIPDTVNPVIIRNKPPSPRTRTLSASARLQNNNNNTGKRSK